MERRLNVFFCGETRPIILLLAERGNHGDRTVQLTFAVIHNRRRLKGYECSPILDGRKGVASLGSPHIREQAEYVMKHEAYEGARLRLVFCGETYQESGRVAKPLVLDME